MKYDSVPDYDSLTDEDGNDDHKVGFVVHDVQQHNERLEDVEED